MNLGDIIGQIFRDSTGMPTKVSSYNVKIGVYDGISSDVTEVENNSIKYLEESRNIDWLINQAQMLKLSSDVSSGIVSPADYALLFDDLEKQKRQILNDFVSSTDLYFITAYRGKLYSVKKRNMRDQYISLMKFDSWFDMEEARELANLAALQIRSSDKYIDAKKIAEIRNKYIMDRHMRRG